MSVLKSLPEIPILEIGVRIDQQETAASQANHIRILGKSIGAAPNLENLIGNRARVNEHGLRLPCLL